jgi:hypothetical protein
MRARGRKGGLIVIIATAMTCLIGFGALVVDVGLAFSQRTRMQMAADAAALAAAKTLKKPESWTRLEAITVAKLNGYKIQGTDIHIDPIKREVAVGWKEYTGFILGPVLNLTGVKVGVNSVAAMVDIEEKTRVMPFMVPKGGYNLGSMMTLKYGAGEGNFGNYGAAAIDGPGAKIYETSIVNGAQTPIRVGMFVDTETGNMVGPTDTGVAALIKGDNTSFDDAIVKPSKRVVTVLVVDPTELADLKGRKPVVIRGFARFYLMGAQNGVVTGRFIDHIFGNNAPPPQETRVKLVR